MNAIIEDAKKTLVAKIRNYYFCRGYKNSASIVSWYLTQNNKLAAGITCPLHARRLYMYANRKSNQHLPERADTWPASERIAALGYDPMD